MLVATILLVAAMVQPPVLVRAEAATTGASWECFYLVRTGGHYVIAQNQGSADACWEAADAWVTALSSPDCSKIVTGHSVVPGSSVRLGDDPQGLEYYVEHDVAYAHSCDSEVGSFRFAARLDLDSVVTNYTIRLSNDANPPASGDLAEVEPGMTTSLSATVYDSNNQPQPGVSVTLLAEVVAESGGHSHHDDDRPIGDLGGTPPLEHLLEKQITGPDGAVHFTFKAPKVAGDHTITANCDDVSCGSDTGKVWVGYRGLQSLSISNYGVYKLVGGTGTHPDNHYLTLAADSRVTVFAAMYQIKYPQQSVLHLNDASLERGGTFDLFPESSPNWKSPHYEHCRGTVIDIRANGGDGSLNITSKDDPMIRAVRKLGAIVGADPVWEVPQDKDHNELWDWRHFHTKLMGQEGIQCP